MENKKIIITTHSVEKIRVRMQSVRMKHGKVTDALKPVTIDAEIVSHNEEEEQGEDVPASTGAPNK